MMNKIINFASESYNRLHNYINENSLALHKQTLEIFERNYLIHTITK